MRTKVTCTALYVLATKHFMESADFGNFSVTAVKVDGLVARLSRQWISEIKLDSIRRNSADPCIVLKIKVFLSHILMCILTRRKILLRTLKSPQW